MSQGAATARRMGGAEWGMLALLSLVWGGSFFFYKVLVQALPPFTVVLGRMAVAALALNLWLAARRDRLPLDPRLWAGLLAAGVLNNALPFSCFAFSEQRITSGLAAILNATTPLFGVLVGAALRTGARLTPARVVAVAIGFAGVTVLVGPSALRGGGDLVSELACLLASLSYAFGSFYARRFSWMDPLKLAAGQTTAATLVMLPLAGLFDHFWTLARPGPPTWGALLGIGLLSTAFAYFLFFRILERAEPTDLMLVTFLVPISALALGVLFLGEPVKPQAFAGMALIGASLAVIDGRLLARLRRAPRLA
ncbi:MAG: DMT family transporter [Caulobacteraceae bacterium]